MNELNRELFECMYIARHLENLHYSEAKAHCVSMRDGEVYKRSVDDGHIDDCYYFTSRGKSMAKKIVFNLSIVIVGVCLYVAALFFIAEKSTGGIFLWVGYGCMILAVLIFVVIDRIKTILQYRKFNAALKRSPQNK